VGADFSVLRAQKEDWFAVYLVNNNNNNNNNSNNLLLEPYLKKTDE